MASKSHVITDVRVIDCYRLCHIVCDSLKHRDVSSVSMGSDKTHTSQHPTGPLGQDRLIGLFVVIAQE